MASYVYLKLQIVRADCMSYKDEKSQPFCEVNCDEESFKTCAVRDSLDPVWKETYIFGNSRKITKTSVCQIKVRDAQNGKELGNATIHLSDLKCDDRPEMVDLSVPLSAMVTNPDTTAKPTLFLSYRMTVGQHPDVVFEGELEKQGGGLGGRANWSTRWFVLLPNKLAYYESKAVFEMGGKPKGVILLNSYYCSSGSYKQDFEFDIHAVPKSLKCRAKSAAEMNMWIKTLNLPSKNVEMLMKP